MSSKLRNISSAQAASAANVAPSPSQISAGQNEIFRELFDQLLIGDVNAQNTQGQGQEQQNAQDNKADADKSGVKTEKSRKSQSAERDSAASENKKVEDADDEMSAEETREVEEMEKSEISVEELARQLNVALTAVFVPEQAPTQIRIVVKGDEGSTADTLQGIDPRLLRQVEASQIDRHLEKLVKDRDLLNVAAPKEEDSRAATDFNDVLTEENHVEMPMLDAAIGEKLADAGDTAEAMAMIAQKREIGISVQARLDALRDKNAIGGEFTDDPESAMHDGAASKGRGDNPHMDFGAGAGGDSAPGVNADTAAMLAQDDVFAESLRVLADRGRLDMTDVVSAKTFVMQAGSDALPTPGQGMRLDHLILPQSATTTGTSPAVTFATGGARVVDKLNAADAMRVRGKVETVVVDMARRGDADTTRIQIHPPTLGKIDITVSVKEKTVRAEVVTDNAATKDAIMHHIPHIKEALAGENLMLDYFNARHDDRHFQPQAGIMSYGDDNSRGGQGHAQEAQESPVTVATRTAGEILRRRAAQDGLVNIVV